MNTQVKLTYFSKLIEFSNTNCNFRFSSNRMCRTCRQNCRIVKFDFQCAKFYHDYAKSSAYSKPDLSKIRTSQNFQTKHTEKYDKIICFSYFFFCFLSLFLQSWFSSYQQLEWNGHMVRDNKNSIKFGMSSCSYIVY